MVWRGKGGQGGTMRRETVDTERIWQKFEELRALTPAALREPCSSFENKLFKLIKAIPEREELTE